MIEKYSLKVGSLKQNDERVPYMQISLSKFRINSVVPRHFCCKIHFHGWRPRHGYNYEYNNVHILSCYYG